MSDNPKVEPPKDDLDEIFMDLRVAVYKVKADDTIDRLLTNGQDRVEVYIKLQQEALLDRFEAKLTDELGYHPPNGYSPECSECHVRTVLNKLRLEL